MPTSTEKPTKRFKRRSKREVLRKAHDLFQGASKETPLQCVPRALRGRLAAADEHEPAVLQQEDGVKLSTPGASGNAAKCLSKAMKDL